MLTRKRELRKGLRLYGTMRKKEGLDRHHHHFSTITNPSSHRAQARCGAVPAKNACCRLLAAFIAASQRQVPCPESGEQALNIELVCH
jgi:hypothetical protein